MWWVIVTNPACELRAAASLADAGFEAWCPMRAVRFKTRHMRKPSTRDYPVFPNYVFAMPTGEVPIWRWERELGEPHPVTGRRSPHGPEVRRQVGLEERIAEPRDLRDLDGVRSYLAHADGYAPVEISDLEMLRVRMRLPDLERKPVDIEAWRKDDVARITDGPWTGCEGIVSDTNKLARRGSITLLLSLFGRQTATEVSVKQLERAA